MKREDKNQLTRGKILASAVAEFARHGYEAGSLNTICQAGGISKGIIYHYFASKDELYLSCLETCFNALTAYLSDQLEGGVASGDRLADYFDARMAFFKAHGDYARLFCGAVVFPPEHLKAAIAERRRAFDGLNQAVLRDIMGQNRLRPDLSEDEVIRVFQQFQDFLNASYQSAFGSSVDVVRHESDCRSALHIFLYGILSRE